MNSGVDPRRAAADRYRFCRSLHGYARGKLALDPAYPAIRDRLAGEQVPLLDVGCGIGLFAAYLIEGGFDGEILGVDPDAAKIEAASRAVPEARFTCGEIGAASGFGGNVVVLDVLHYFEPKRREEFLGEVIARVAPRAAAYIRTTPRDGSWRYWVTQLEEVFVRASRWIVGGAWNFPTVEEIVRPFERAGFDIRKEPMWGRTPFNSVLFECRAPTE